MVLESVSSYNFLKLEDIEIYRKKEFGVAAMGIQTRNKIGWIVVKRHFYSRVNFAKNSNFQVLTMEEIVTACWWTLNSL